jgi:hypothetical protein
MKSLILCAAATILLPAGAIATVIVESHDQPLVASTLEGRDRPLERGGLVAPVTKANGPANGLWFVPYFEVDRVVDGDSTYFAIRSESLLPSSVVAEFFDVNFELEVTETYDLEPRQVKSVALKHVPGLPVDGDGYARGLIRFSSLIPITMDVFQLETRNSFAVGGPGFVEADMCTRWHARFLRFDTAGGTTLSMMINGPRGVLLSDPATVVGDVYTEGGDFVGSFSIRTDEWALQLPVHDLVPSGLDFGVVEIVINSVFLPSGIVEVQHRALGRFSVGHAAMCMD